MAATIIDGKAHAERMRRDIAARAERLTRAGHRPTLATVLAGDDAGARMYADSQRRKCEELGLGYRLETLGPSATQADLLALIGRLNADPAVDGVMVQAPLGAGLDASAAQAVIAADKDVEGVSPTSLGLLAAGRPRLLPCTAHAAWELIQASGVPVAGAEAVVIGRSAIVGRPAALILIGRHATVTVCHTRTRDLAAVARRADILVVAAGRANMVNADFIKPGALVIDVGTNRVTETGADGRPVKRTVGDVDFESACRVAGAITPVPGGVGPVTVALLLRNVVDAAERHPGGL